MLAIAAAMLVGALPLAARNPLRVAFVGDPQVKDSTELVFAQRSVYAELGARTDIDLVVVLGDLVSDNPSLLEPSVKSLDSLGIPWVCAPGNHDRDMPGKGRPRLLEDFSRTVGSPDTSFVLKGVRFIVMNNVRTIHNADYEGGFSEAQKSWLGRQLAATPERMRAVLCTHIPIHECKGLDTLSAILGQHGRLLLASGHTHTVRRHVLEFPDGLRLEELVAGATCGTWWRGEPDENGIPSATMSCGAPRGYFVADFSRRDYSLSYKVAGRPDEVQASAFQTPDGLVLNVFGGHMDGELQVRTPDGWKTCRRASIQAPECKAISDLNSSLTRAERKALGRAYIPMLNRPSPHVWMLDGAKAAEASVRIRYSDAHMRFTATVAVANPE